jgi:hypothetical protein
VGFDAPVGVGLEFVVVAAQGLQVVGAGGAAVGPRVDVIEFGVGGGAAAAGEAAVDVAGE